MYLSKIFTDPVLLLKKLKKEDEDFWIKRGQKMALGLFYSMAERVPAYKDFLKKNKISVAKIKTIEDFKFLPKIDKHNYLKIYDLEKLCWDGNLKDKRWTISSTSGSTGEPFYFPREEEQDLQYARTAEMYLRTNFQIHKKSTLYIDAFPMGPWIGGVFTFSAIRLIAEEGKYPLSIITTSIDKNEIIKAVKKFGDKFDQIIIGSYAPFLKDTLDDGIRQGLDWKKYNLGFIFSAEAFSENFRDYVIKKTGLKNPYTTTLNHYGTVDLGTMSHETPASILIRRMALAKEPLYKDIFGDITKTPTLTQFLPEMFYFENEEGNLLCSAYSGLPLVRYDLHDHGGMYTFSQIKDKFLASGIKLEQEIGKAKLNSTVWNLPFVYVFERSDFSVSFYAFNIYPETVRRALQEDVLEDKITGKFTMLVIDDDKLNQCLEINVELKSGVSETSDLHKLVGEIVFDRLLKENSEYRRTYEDKGHKVFPKIVFWPYEDLTHFRSGIKQKWVKK